MDNGVDSANKAYSNCYDKDDITENATCISDRNIDNQDKISVMSMFVSKTKILSLPQLIFILYS